MATPPKGMIYGVDDKPPFFVTVLLGLQHIFTMSSMLVLPVVIVQEIGGNFLEINSVVSFSMIAAGFGTILQSLKRGPIGSGYLCPNLCGPSYMAVSLEAGWLGGLPLMHGMIMLSGLAEMAFAQVIPKLKKLFPPEITGLVVIMVGVALIPLGVSRFIGVEYSGDSIEAPKIIIACITLGVMIGLNLWGKGKIRLYGVLIGIIVGYLLSLLAGLIGSAELKQVSQTPLFALPGQGVKMFRYAFDPSLIIPFVLISIIQCLKSFGNIITCQKLSDDDWKEPDLKNVGKGLMASGISVFTCGLLGGVATDTSASNVGLSAATGANSRIIAWSAGGIFILLGFLPKMAALFTIMPQPVMGAIVVFVTCFMLISGMQIILANPISTRMIFIIGISMIFGLSADISSSLFFTVPSWLVPVCSSSLTVSAMLAVILNQIFVVRDKPRANSISK
ncbi:MAG: solute carrier family 23 protein [Bacteroidota bacterium]